MASDNPGGCGVILAGHSTAGVTDNLVAHNLLTDNGTLKSSGGGAGVVIATEVPGENGGRQIRRPATSSTATGSRVSPFTPTSPART